MARTNSIAGEAATTADGPPHHGRHPAINVPMLTSAAADSTTHALVVVPRHDDGALCGHPPEGFCPDMRDLLAVCACGWHIAGTVRRGLEVLHAEHVRALAGGAL